MPYRRRPRRSSNRVLTFEQELELVLGQAGDVSEFESPKAKREAWEEQRDRLMALVNPATRPAAWWEFEAPEPKRVIRKVPMRANDGALIGTWDFEESDEDYLRRLDLLTDEERRIVAEWDHQREESRRALGATG